MPVGNVVRITNPKSVMHGKVGVVMEFDWQHSEGKHWRPYKIRFNMIGSAIENWYCWSEFELADPGDDDEVGQ